MTQNNGTDDLPFIDTDQTLQLPKETPCFTWLVVLRGPRRGRLFPLKADGVSIGRSSENDITVDDETSSRHHARIYADDGAVRSHFSIPPGA